MNFVQLVIEAVDAINLAIADQAHVPQLVVCYWAGEVVVNLGEHNLFSSLDEGYYDDEDNELYPDVRTLTRVLIERLEEHAKDLRNSAYMARKELLS